MIHISYYFFFNDDFNDYYEKLKLENVTLVYVKVCPPRADVYHCACIERIACVTYISLLQFCATDRRKL